MPQVSRKPLSKNIEEKMFAIFFKALARLSKSSDIQSFLFDLLSPVERTMLAKRLAIALLLAKGYSYEAIKEVLNVSQETIARVNISVSYGGSGYRLVVQKTLRDEKIEDIFDKVEDATIAVLPDSLIKRSFIHARKTHRKPKTSLG